LISHCRFPYKKIDFLLSLFVYILFALFPSTLINSPATVRGLTLVSGLRPLYLGSHPHILFDTIRIFSGQYLAEKFYNLDTDISGIKIK
jgi:hypothetical protein